MSAEHKEPPAAPSGGSPQANQATAEGDEDMGLGEDVGHFGDVIVEKDGQVRLKYDHGGIPWYLTILYLGYISFAIYYAGTYLIDLF